MSSGCAVFESGQKVGARQSKPEVESSVKLIISKSLSSDRQALTRAEDLRQIKAAGYDAVSWYAPACGAGEWRRTCEQTEIDFLGYVAGGSVEELLAKTREIEAFAPQLIVVDSLVTHYPARDVEQHFRTLLKELADSEKPVAHLTSRRSPLGVPSIARSLLQTLPELRLATDFAAWCVSSASLLEDFDDLVELAAPRTIHIEGRIGAEHAPQVSDPRAPEYQLVLERHEQWWDAVHDAQKQAFAAQLWITAAFAPAPWAPALPFTQQPLASTHDLDQWLATRLRRRWDR